MPEPERYEALILGSGEGGKYLAWHLARSGRRTAVIERRLIGGSCPNTNCTGRRADLKSRTRAILEHGKQKRPTLVSTLRSSPWPSCYLRGLGRARAWPFNSPPQLRFWDGFQASRCRWNGMASDGGKRVSSGSR